VLQYRTFGCIKLSIFCFTNFWVSALACETVLIADSDGLNFLFRTGVKLIASSKLGHASQSSTNSRVFRLRNRTMAQVYIPMRRKSLSKAGNLLGKRNFRISSCRS
jgi:hypothetical protein